MIRYFGGCTNWIDKLGGNMTSEAVELLYHLDKALRILGREYRTCDCIGVPCKLCVIHNQLHDARGVIVQLELENL